MIKTDQTLSDFKKSRSNQFILFRLVPVNYLQPIIFENHDKESGQNYLRNSAHNSLVQKGCKYIYKIKYCICKYIFYKRTLYSINCNKNSMSWK